MITLMHRSEKTKHNLNAAAVSLLYAKSSLSTLMSRSW